MLQEPQTEWLGRKGRRRERVRGCMALLGVVLCFTRSELFLDKGRTRLVMVRVSGDDFDIKRTKE